MWLFVIFSFSHTPGDTSARQVKTLLEKVVSLIGKLIYKTGIVSEPVSDEDIMLIVRNNYMVFRKMCHFFVFFVLGIISYLAVSVVFNKGMIFSLVMAIVFSIGYSVFDELHQSTIIGRRGMFTDCLIDAGGVMVASALIYSLTYKIKPKEIFLKKN